MIYSSQVLQVVYEVVLYYPFFKLMEKQKLKEENATD